MSGNPWFNRVLVTTTCQYPQIKILRHLQHPVPPHPYLTTQSRLTSICRDKNLNPLLLHSHNPDKIKYNGILTISYPGIFFETPQCPITTNMIQHPLAKSTKSIRFLFPFIISIFFLTNPISFPQSFLRYLPR